MPILYHPTASYQYYIAPGSSSVSITAVIFGVGGVTLDSETTTQSTASDPLVRGSGFAEPFSPDLTALTRFGVNQKIYKGDFQQSATAEASNLRRTNLNSDFAATSHPTLHIDKPNVYTTTEDFDLNIYTFHGGGILGVDVSVEGGTASAATLVSDPTTDGFGGKYTIPITSSTIGVGSTAEIRITSKPRNGYDRTMQMKLVYASGENKVQIDTNTGISAGVAAVMSNWDETKKNILELTESGNYTIGTNSNSSETYEYGAVEVRPAAGVTAEIDLTYGSTNFPVEGQSNSQSTGVRPKLNQMTWKNITFKQLLNENDPYLWSESTKLGSNSDSPNVLGYTGPTVQRTGIYLEDNAYTTRWTFIGCTMEQNWIDGTTQGVRYLFLDGSTSGSVGGGRLNGLKPTDHQMFRYSKDQQLYFIDTFANQMQYPYSSALMCSNSISHRCYQDSYTNVKFSVGCKSTEKYMAGVATGPDGVGATFIEATLSRHPDHWQLFRGGSRSGIEFHNNQGVTFNKLGVMNYALYGYEGDDIPRATQHFGFFGSPAREYYVDVAMVKSKWTGSTAGDQKSQIGENFDNILLIGLESTKPLLIDSDFNYPDPTIPPPASAEEQYGPVLLAGSTFGDTINILKWNALTILEGRTLGFLPVGNIIPTPIYQGNAGTDDSLLGTYYVWNVPGVSLTNVNVSNARNIFAKDGNSPSDGWYIGSNSSAGASLTSLAPSTVVALGGSGSFNTDSRVMQFGLDGDKIDQITLYLYDGTDQATAFANSGGSAGWYGKLSTSNGDYVYSAKAFYDTGQAGGNGKLEGYDLGVLGGASAGITLGDLLDGFTFELKTTPAAPLTRFFTPDFTLPNPQPSESSFNNGGHTGGQAVGYIEMPERIWTPGATVDFCVSANVVDLEGINKVVVSCHGSTAEVSTVTKGSNGVQGYWFTMTLPAGATTGTPKLYADIIPFNGESRVVEKEFRSLTPTYVDIAAGDLTDDIITPYIGHGFGTIGSDNMVLRLGAGTFYLTQAGLGTLNNKWQEITTNGDVDTTVVICSDPSNLGRTSGTPSVRFDHTIFNGVTVDFGPAQLISGGRGTYVGFEDCSLVDSWWNQSQGGRPYGVFNGGGIEKNELQQSIFDQYSSPVREPVFEVYNTAIDSPVGGGAVLYHNVTMNCSFDPIFMQLGQYNNGSTAGQAYYERGFHINKLESLGGPWRFGGRQHFRDFLTVAGVTLEGSNTRITFTDSNFEWEGGGYTHEDGTSTTPADEMYLSRSDYMIGRWNSTEALTTYNREWLDPVGSNQVRLYGQGNGITHSILALNTNWVSSGLTAGDRIIVSTWAHPDAFQISRNTTATGFTGATVDNWLIQDYRCYQDHQPMLFHSSTTAILNCVVDNCSFEQYSEPPDNYFAQFEGLPKQFAIKNTSFPRTKSFSIRNNADEYIPGDMFLIDGCFLRQIGGDNGGPSMPYIRVTNTVYQQAVNATGISFGTGTSILAADQYTIANGRISKFGVPQSSVGTTTTRALPYTIHGTERSATREVGAYAVGDTPSDWVAPTSEVIIPAGSLTSLQLLIDNTPVGGTLDLNGGVYSMMGPTQAASLGFTADYNDVTGVVWTGINVDESITITDGTISISELHTPTNRGDGTFSVPNTTNESLIQMFDPDSSQELIRLATYPPQYKNRTSTFFVDASSFDLNAARGVIVNGGPITDKPIDSSKPMNGILTQNLIDGNYYTSGFTVIGATLVNDIKTMLDSVVANESAYSTRTEAATNVGMIININPNQIYPQVVGEYAEGTSGGDDILGITFAGGTADWFSRSADNQYIREFNFFGRVSFGLTGASGTYYTYGDDEIIYKPLSGKCNNIYLPHLAADQYNPLGQYGGFVFRNNGGLDQAGGRSDIRFNNCTTIGGGAYRGTHSGKHFHDVRAQGGEVTSSLTLRNHTTYIGTSIYGGSNGATFDVEECRFIGPATNGIGGAGGDSFFINKCEFRGGFYKSSAISKTNSSMLPPSIGKLQPTRVTNSVFDFDSNHGQAISAYASTYINTEISGNVFVNTPRPVSAQWALVDASLVHDLSSYGGFTFSNNLHYMHQLPAQNATGQAGIAFNGDVPRTLSMELSSLLPGSPTEDGFYGITAGDSKYNLSGYCVELTNGDLPRVKIQLLGRGYRVRGGTGYILGNIDRWDLVDTQENYFNSRYEIDGRSGPSGTLLNGDITIHEISGGTVGDVVVSGITCENTLLVTNIPDTYIENNTVMLSRDIITEEADGLFTQNVQNCLNLQFNGGSSGLKRNVSTIGPQKIRNNIILGHQGTNATRRAGKTGGYDIVSGVTLDVNANGVYSLNDNIVSLGYGENEVTGNTFLLFSGFSEGFVDGYTGPVSNQRKNFLSKSLGTTVDAYYNSDERIGTTAQQAEAFDQVFTWNNGDGTIEPKSGYSGGCYWSSYPTWNEIDSLGYTFSTLYTPREITP